LDPQMPVGRVVLLGTPATGSRVAHRLARSTVARALIGRALLEWRPERGTVVAAMCDVGMIAGTLRFGIGSFLLDLPAPNDGVVCLEETRMSGLCDHLEMHLSHSGMIVSSRATNQICHFLEHGHFARR